MKFLSQINVNTEYTLPIVDGTNGQVLTTDGSGAVYWGSVSIGALNLDGLQDVVITTPTSGQILRYGIPVGSEDPNPVWYNWSPNFLTFASSIDALADVTITSAATGQLLQWNGSAWVNATLSTVEYVSKVQHTVKAGVAISKGQAVYVTGADGTNMIVALASNASEATSSKVIGLAVSNAAINDQIFVVTEGLIAGLNTSTATAGDPVWLGTNGNLIFGLANKPVAPAHLVYIGVVTRVQQNNGEIFVNVQNGFELNEIHDALIVSPTAGQLLRRDSDNLWKNWTPNYLTAESDTLATVTARGATTTGNIVVNGEISLPSFIRLTNAGANNAYISESWGINLNGASTHPIQVRSASLSVGYTLGAGTSYGSGNLFVSDKIGVNTTAPTKALDVVGSGIVASFGGAFSAGSFAGIHFGYSETQYGNDNYKKSALVFERTDNHIGQGSNASGKIHFLLNNAGGTSATSLSHSVVTIDSNANGTAGTARVGIGRTSPFYALDVNGQTNSTSFVSTSILILDADLNQGQQPQQGDPANKVASFRWAGNEQGYIDTDAKITFAGFKTPTGTASQFLKANGTVDSNTYLTTTSAASLYTTYDYVDDEIASVNTYVGNTFVPKTRTLTINGTAFDLSANRSWTIATTDSTKVSKSGESHDTVLPDTLAAGDGGFYTVASGYGPSGGNDALIHVPYVNNLWAHQIAMDWALGDAQDMWFRTKNNGTWQAWKKVWHDGNFTPSNYQLASTAINTGNIATQSVAYATSSGNSNLLKSLGSYVWSTSTNGRDFAEGVQVSFVREADGYQSFGSVVRVHTYPNDGASAELYFPYSEEYGGNSMQYRLGLYNNAGWSSWKTVVDSENIGLYALTSLPAHTHTIANVTGLQTALDEKVPTTRTLTINGTAYDLSANRSWTISTNDSTKVPIVGDVEISGMKSFTTNVSSQEDWQNSPISILERDGIGSGSASDIYSPNINFHWRNRVSRSIWMDASGGFHFGEYSATGVPSNDSVLYAGGGDSSRWNDAYSWGNHAGLYAAASHTHTIANVTGLQTALDGKLSTSGKAADSELLDGVDESRFVYGNSNTRRGTNLISNWNQTDYPDVAFLSAESGGSNAPNGDYTYGLQYSFHRSGAAYRTQFVTSLYSDLDIWVRNSRDSDVWTSWKKLIHSGNIGSQSVAYATSSGNSVSTDQTNFSALFIEDSPVATKEYVTSQGYITGYTETDPIYVSERDSLQLNKTVHPTLLFSTLADYNKPSGYSTMIQPSSYQNPLPSHGYYHIIARRDTSGGYGALLQSYNSHELYHGNTVQSTTDITWYKIWNSGDFTSTSITNWNTAFGWGNHASAGYAPLNAPSFTSNATLIGAHQSGYGMLRLESSDAMLLSMDSLGNGWNGLRLKNTGSDWAFFGKPDAVSDKIVIDFGFDGTNEFEFSSGGNLTIKGTITEQSSIRFKENITPLDPALDKVNQLEAVSYNKIGEDNREIGLIAEDVAELFPEVVTYNDEGQPQGIQYQRLSVILLKAVQELTERVNKLENK